MTIVAPLVRQFVYPDIVQQISSCGECFLHQNLYHTIRSTGLIKLAITCFPYAALSPPNNPLLMRSPMCQYIIVIVELTVTATCVLAYSIICLITPNASHMPQDSSQVQSCRPWPNAGFFLCPPYPAIAPTGENSQKVINKLRCRRAPPTELFQRFGRMNVRK